MTEMQRVERVETIYRWVREENHGEDCNCEVCYAYCTILMGIVIDRVRESGVKV